MSSPRATEASSGDVQGAIVDDFVYVVTAAAERDDDTLDLCVAQLQDGVGEALAGAVIRAGLASSNSPPVTDGGDLQSPRAGLRSLAEERGSPAI